MKLTPAQERVIRELANGYDPPEIAERLNLSIWTVRTHIRMAADEIGGNDTPIRRCRRWALTHLSQEAA